MKFQDYRSGKLIVVAHCILNQNSRVLGLASYPAVIDEVVDVLRKHDVAFLQMPCPELTYAGAKRPRKTRGEYDTSDYRKHCKKIAISISNQIKEFAKGGVKAIAVLGIENSPSCGISNSTSEVGILMEELTSEIGKAGLKLPMYAIESSGTISGEGLKYI